MKEKDLNTNRGRQYVHCSDRIKQRKRMNKKIDEWKKKRKRERKKINRTLSYCYFKKQYA